MLPQGLVRFAFAVFVVGLAATERVAAAAVPTSIRSYQIASIDRARGAAARGRIQLSVRAPERSFDLDLEPSPVLAPGARSVVVDGLGEHSSDSSASAYRGHLADDPDADVRVVLTETNLVGSVRQGDQTWYFEPMRSYDASAPANQVLVYRAADVEAATSSPGDCDIVEAPASSPSALAAPSSPNTTSRAAEGVRHHIVELTLVADYQFFQSRGADSAAYMLSVIDRIAEVYRMELGVLLEVVQTVVYDSPGVEPFVDFTSGASLLLSVGAARRDYPALLGQGDLTHLFTGRDLDANMLGIAYRGGICGITQGVGLSQLFDTQLHEMGLLVAHEIGHGLGAYHDGQGGTPCAAVGRGHIMWTPFESSLLESFSGCSRETIVPVVAAASCAEPAPCGDGDLDPGEECDDGGNDRSDCCSPECEFDGAGIPCESDGNDCTADACDGAGGCYAPQYEGGLCDDDQACTLSGTCSTGSCLPSATLRALDKSSVKARFGDQVEDHRMEIFGFFQGDSSGGPPTEDGVSVRLLESDGSVLHESTIAGASWVADDDTGRRFRYVADGEPLPEAGGATEMSVRFRDPNGKPSRYRVKGKFSGIDLNVLAGRSEIGLEVTVGNAVEGLCGTAATIPCKMSSERLRCR